MKLTKLGHSCVLVEAAGKCVLFDAGGWSDRSLIEAIPQIDEIVYTHEHGDHFDADILRALVAKFPTVQVVCNKEIGQLIQDGSIQVQIAEETEDIHKFSSPHGQAPWPGAIPPAENGYHFADFSHPGDSHNFSETRRVLAVPFIGPWALTADAIQKVIELKPEYVLPIHDWLLSEEGKNYFQMQLQSSFQTLGIKLLENENGKVIEIA